MLVSTEPGKLLTRRTLEGKRRFVVHLASAGLYAGEQGESGEQGGTPEKRGGTCPCSSPGCPEQGELQREQPQGKAASAPVPPIPPVAGWGEAPRGDNPNGETEGGVWYAPGAEGLRSPFDED